MAQFIGGEGLDEFISNETVGGIQAQAAPSPFQSFLTSFAQRAAGGGRGGRRGARGGDRGQRTLEDLGEVGKKLPPGLSGEQKEELFAQSQQIATQGARDVTANISARTGGDVSSQQFQQSAGRAFTGAAAGTAAGLSAINIADIRQEQQLELQRRGQILQAFGLETGRQQVTGQLGIAGQQIGQEQQRITLAGQELGQRGDIAGRELSLREQELERQGDLSIIQLAGQFPGLFGSVGFGPNRGAQRAAIGGSLLNLGVNTDASGGRRVDAPLFRPGV